MAQARVNYAQHSIKIVTIHPGKIGDALEHRQRRGEQLIVINFQQLDRRRSSQQIEHPFAMSAHSLSRWHSYIGFLARDARPHLPLRRYDVVDPHDS